MALTKANKLNWGVLAADPVPSSLLHHVTPDTNVTWADGKDLGESFNCLDVENEIPWPCPVGTLDAPEGLDVTASVTGGTIAAGTYVFAVATLTGSGESTPSATDSVTTTGNTASVTATWEPVEGALGYRVYAGPNAGALTAQAMSATPSLSLTAISATGPSPQTVNGAVYRGPKLFEGPVQLDGFTFVTQGGLTCGPYGFTLEKGEAALRRAYELRESKGVERAFVKKAFTDAVDLTDGDAVDPMLAVALLEGYAGSAYAGAPFLHVSRTIGSLLLQCEAIAMESDRAHTRLGAKVAIGAGYEYPSLGPDGLPAPAGEQWVYATGGVHIARGELLLSEASDVVHNDFTIQGERAYVGAIDCFSAAIRVKVRA